MQVDHYYSSSGKDLILEYLDSLPLDERVDGLSVIECMKNDEFDKIFFKQWQKKVYEVYFRKNRRIFYIMVDKNDIYLLHACKKQKNQTEKKDKQIVIKRTGKVFT